VDYAQPSQNMNTVAFSQDGSHIVVLVTLRLLKGHQGDNSFHKTMIFYPDHALLAIQLWDMVIRGGNDKVHSCLKV
jgi:hypothetical protein